MARRTTALLGLMLSAAALVPPTTHQRRTSARHSVEEDDDPYLSPRSRLAGYVRGRRHYAIDASYDIDRRF